MNIKDWLYNLWLGRGNEIGFYVNWAQKYNTEAQPDPGTRQAQSEHGAHNV